MGWFLRFLFLTQIVLMITGTVGLIKNPNPNDEKEMFFLFTGMIAGSAVWYSIKKLNDEEFVETLNKKLNVETKVVKCICTDSINVNRC